MKLIALFYIVFATSTVLAQSTYDKIKAGFDAANFPITLMSVPDKTESMGLNCVRVSRNAPYSVMSVHFYRKLNPNHAGPIDPQIPKWIIETAAIMLSMETHPVLDKSTPTEVVLAKYMSWAFDDKFVLSVRSQPPYLYFYAENTIEECQDGECSRNNYDFVGYCWPKP